MYPGRELAMTEGANEAIPESFPEEFRDGRWLSYDELGKIRGIGRPSAVKLAQREKWPRRLGNDRTARVLVPLEWLKPAKPPPEGFREDVDIFPEGFRDTGAIWREAIQVASAAFERETTALRADHARELEQAAATIEALTAERGLLRGHVEALQANVKRVQAEAQDARDAAEAAQIAQGEAEADAAELRQAEAERRARGLLARLRAALRGE
jgi:hypothetical protein